MNLGSGPGLYPPNVSSPPSIMTPKRPPGIASCCLGGKITLGDFKSTTANYYRVTQEKLLNHKGPASLLLEKEVVTAFTVHSWGLAPVKSPRRASL